MINKCCNINYKRLFFILSYLNAITSLKSKSYYCHFKDEKPEIRSFAKSFGLSSSKWTKAEQGIWSSPENWEERTYGPFPRLPFLQVTLKQQVRSTENIHTPTHTDTRERMQLPAKVPEIQQSIWSLGTLWVRGTTQLQDYCFIEHWSYQFSRIYFYKTEFSLCYTLPSSITRFPILKPLLFL